MISDPLQSRISASPRGFLRNVWRLWRLRGVPPTRQLVDIATLVLMRKQMELGEYFLNFPPEYRHGQGDRRIADFVGENGSGLWINRALWSDLPPETLTLLQDKLATAEALTRLGLAVPETLALHRAEGEPPPCGAPLLRDAAAIAAFLRDPRAYPLFGKPAAEDMSIGVVSLSAFDPAADAVVTLDGRRVPVPELAGRIAASHSGGYLFQRRLRQSPEVASICGEGVGALRIVCVRDGGPPAIAYAAWKIPAPAAATDHPDLPGAMIADVDPATGALRRLQRGAGFEACLVDGAERGGRPLLGMILPGWPAAAAAAQKAMEIAPQARAIGWDVALGVSGPVILEGNWRPSHVSYQAASGRGALTLPLADLSSRRGTALGGRPPASRTGRPTPLRRLAATIRGLGRRPPMGWS